ncbi:hypothetical protein Patl1_14190 [Pistacia atlantica]|uniref:Uncharacterized protein n=1 Tax=Pistacia atlantica TaxID=434234 RepID=A0ACC1AU21_9ROSI|nr:hypothetical protein Patl1_14190 [Pistacia atlantica]
MGVLGAVKIKNVVTISAFLIGHITCIPFDFEPVESLRILVCGVIGEFYFPLESLRMLVSGVICQLYFLASKVIQTHKWKCQMGCLRHQHSAPFI